MACSVRPGEPVFVDTGAWIALALTRDPLHARARATWEELLGAGVRFQTSVPVVLETFTFLDRNAARKVALAWKDSLKTVALISCASSRISTGRSSVAPMCACQRSRKA